MTTPHSWRCGQGIRYEEVRMRTLTLMGGGSGSEEGGADSKSAG